MGNTHNVNMQITHQQISGTDNVISSSQTSSMAIIQMSMIGAVTILVIIGIVIGIIILAKNHVPCITKCFKRKRRVVSRDPDHLPSYKMRKLQSLGNLLAHHDSPV